MDETASCYDLVMRKSEAEDLLEQKLYELGYLEEIKPPITDLTPYRNRILLEVKGESLSESIINDRR